MIRQLIRAGELGPRSLVWRHGLRDWTPVAAWPSIATAGAHAKAACTVVHGRGPGGFAEVEQSGEHGVGTAEWCVPPTPAAWRNEVATCWYVRETHADAEDSVEWDWVWDERRQEWLGPDGEALEDANADASWSDGMPPPAADGSAGEYVAYNDDDDIATTGEQPSRSRREAMEAMGVLVLLLVWYAGGLALLAASTS